MHLELAIHTINMNVLNMVFDLVVLPECQDDPRQGLHNLPALECSRNTGGKWDGTFLKGL